MLSLSVICTSIPNGSGFRNTRGANGGQESGEVHLPTMDELIPGLQPLVLWMANSIELLHFIQQEVPSLLPWNPEGTLRHEDTAHLLMVTLQERNTATFAFTLCLCSSATIVRDTVLLLL